MSAVSNEGQPRSRWHVDKTVPIALIVALLISSFSQVIAGVVWATRMDQRVSRLEEDNRDLKPQPEKITRLETKMEAVQDGIRDLAGKMDQLLLQRPSGR